jgi:hypothetical protein
MRSLFSSKALASIGLGAVLAVAAAASAQAAPAPPKQFEAIDTSMCSAPQLTQPFLFAKDNNFYSLMPGEEPSSFTGEGWELRNGAKIVTTTVAGQATHVLDLPSGSEAISPTICVTNLYPTARTMVRNVKGSEGVFTYVSYEATHTWEAPKNTGQVHGQASEWSASGAINLQPNNTSGWQRLRMILVPGGKTSEFQVYDFYVDPRLGH